MAPTVRLAHISGAQGDNVLLGQRGVQKLPREEYPALLCAYPFIKRFLRDQKKYAYRNWALDSGAFSVHSTGIEVDIEEYMRTSKVLLKRDKTLVEVFALDVIGDAIASAENARLMNARGIRAIPTFHFSSKDWGIFKDLVASYPKIALGGMVGAHKGQKIRFIEKAFSLAWPKKIHGFGIAGREIVLTFPFHSVDASSWEVGPARYGRWASYGKLSWRGSSQDLRVEIRYHLDLEKEMRARWRKEMALLEAL